MDGKQGSNIPGWAIVLGFIFCWPVGLVLLFLNLGGVSVPTNSKTQAPGATRYVHSQGTAAQQAQATPPAAQSATAQGGFRYAQSAAPQGYQRRDGAQDKAQRQDRGLRRFLKQPKSGRTMTAIGAVMSFIFALGFVDEFSYALNYGLLRYATDWFPVFGFLCAGLFLFFKGLSKTQLARRMKLYQGVIGQRSSIFISDLAGAAGVPEKKVIADLQRMISDGYLPLGYIDRASGRLVLTDEGYAPPAPEPKKAAAPQRSKTEEDPDQAILREIRAVNDAIPDPEMSRKIERIEEITGKILDYQKKNPAKAGELRQFLNYYLPTTLKILSAYARMDAQGIDGENISAAKKRIEGMMDKVVEGFEKQLDQLFQADAMDIATDVDVLERMLEKDGLGSGMTMGGT